MKSRAEHRPKTIVVLSERDRAPVIANFIISNVVKATENSEPDRISCYRLRAASKSAEKHIVGSRGGTFSSARHISRRQCALVLH